MRTLTFPDGHTARVYESVYELPVLRHAEFQVYRLYATGIGSNEAAIERHFAQLYQFLAAGRTDDAVEQTIHLQYAHQFVLDRFTPQTLAFACLVADIDGQPATDLSESGLQAVVSRLSELGLTQGQVDEVIDAVKKKVHTELSQLFPQRYGDESDALATAQQLRRRLLAVCDFLQTDDPRHLDTVTQVDTWLLDQQRPACFDDGAAANVVVAMRRSFAQLCAVLAGHGTAEPERLTVFQFETRVEWLQQKLAQPRERHGV